MLVLDAAVAHARRARDWGRVEADIALLIEDRPGQGPHLLTLRTSQPEAGAAPLRARLIADAIRLARAMSANSVHRPADRPSDRAA